MASTNRGNSPARRASSGSPNNRGNGTGKNSPNRSPPRQTPEGQGTGPSSQLAPDMRGVPTAPKGWVHVKGIKGLVPSGPAANQLTVTASSSAASTTGSNTSIADNPPREKFDIDTKKELLKKMCSKNGFPAGLPFDKALRDAAKSINFAIPPEWTARAILQDEQFDCINKVKRCNWSFSERGCDHSRGP